MKINNERNIDEENEKQLVFGKEQKLRTITDDSLLVLKLVSRLIEGEGHIVDCKKDGLEALEALKNIEYDAVLMDIHMPEMSKDVVWKGCVLCHVIQR